MRNFSEKRRPRRDSRRINCGVIIIIILKNQSETIFIGACAEVNIRFIHTEKTTRQCTRDTILSKENNKTI